MTEQPSILLAFDWQDNRIYRGIAQYAHEHNWHLSPYLFNQRFIPHNWPGDGAITCYGKTLGPFIDSLDMPIVDISFETLPREAPKVLTDNQKVAELAADHFLERGYHHFACYSWQNVPVNRLRTNAFMEALEVRGVPKENIHLIKQSPGKILGDWDLHQEHILEQINALPRPLAVFAEQDNLGATLIEICLRNGIHVPEEVAVLGVDNIEFICSFLRVPMSSVDTRFEALGYAAASRLGELLRGEISADAPPVSVPPQEIICRRSTDILAVAHPAVVKALQFLKDCYHKPITLEDIAEHADMSKRGMEKAFLKHLNRSPATELRRIRLDNAKRMLTETDDKIEAIAMDCGYSNSSNLSFAFKKETGMSPRAYRVKFGPDS